MVPEEENSNRERLLISRNVKRLEALQFKSHETSQVLIGSHNITTQLSHHGLPDDPNQIENSDYNANIYNMLASLDMASESQRPFLPSMSMQRNELMLSQQTNRGFNQSSLFDYEQFSRLDTQPVTAS